MEDKMKMYLAVAAIFLVIVIPLAWHFSHGGGSTTTTTTTTTPTTTTTSSSTTSSVPSTSVVTVTNVETVTKTLTTTELSESTYEYAVKVPVHMETASVIETVEMYGLSIPKTTVVTTVPATFMSDEVIVGDETLSLVEVSGVPVSAVYYCCMSSTVIQTDGIDIPYVLPMKMELVSPVMENGTFKASFVAPWPEVFGGTIKGYVIIDTLATIEGTYEYIMTFNGIVKTVTATLMFTGTPEEPITSTVLTTNITQTVTITTTTEVTNVTTTTTTISP